MMRKRYLISSLLLPPSLLSPGPSECPSCSYVGLRKAPATPKPLFKPSVSRECRIFTERLLIQLWIWSQEVCLEKHYTDGLKRFPAFAVALSGWSAFTSVVPVTLLPPATEFPTVILLMVQKVSLPVPDSISTASNMFFKHRVAVRAAVWRLFAPLRDYCMLLYQLCSTHPQKEGQRNHLASVFPGR